jgi:murein DD-endopeptidase MepM/ murein hydrolase activator NlpD
MDNQALFDALDTELALRLAKAQPLGLGNQLVQEITHGPVSSAGTPDGVPGVALTRPHSRAHEATLSSAGTPDGVPGLPAAPSIASPRATGEGGSAVTSGFGWRQDPLTGVPAFHKGIDVRATYGEAVTAAGPGRVVVAQSQGGYGQTVVVDHGGGLQTRYAHLSAISVQVGDTVDAGASVGRAGRSGRATGTHVHFEATQGSQPVDPAEFPLRLKAATLVADVGSGRPTDSWR